LACDLIIASENAKFALPEPKVGLAALAGGMHRLPRQIGLKRAMSMMLTGRTVSAEEGLNLGFVNEVTKIEELMITAESWAQLILDCSPTSIRTTKDVAMSGLAQADIEDAMSAKYESVNKYSKVKILLKGLLLSLKKENQIGPENNH
jgi:enoyl-CoA hydratase/carnithine racemase